MIEENIGGFILKILEILSRYNMMPILLQKPLIFKV